MSYLMYLTLLSLVCLTWIVVAFIVGNSIEKHLRKLHRAKQIKQTRAAMQAEFRAWQRAVAHNKTVIQEQLNK